MKNLLSLCFVLLLLFSTACKNDEPTMDPNAQCNEYIPVLMLHGFLAASDTYKNFNYWFEYNGYCENWLYTMDRNTLDQATDFTIELDSMVNVILTETGASKINLIGHSAGGGLGYDYLSTAAHANKVNQYVHLASFVNDAPAGPNAEIPTLNIWSESDLIVEGANIDGAENVMLTDADHYQVATNSDSFINVYSFFNDGKIPTVNIVNESAGFNVSGKAVTLGENTPIANATIEIYALDKETGFRNNNEPDIVIGSEANGTWGPINLLADTYYEFLVINNDNPLSRQVHYYIEPVEQSTPLLYLRTIPPLGSLAGLLLSALPTSDEQAVMAFFAASQAVVYGRDALTVNEENLATEAFTSLDQSTIAMFLYDNGNSQTDASSHGGLFDTSPFLNAVDVYFEPDENNYSTIEFNGRKLNIPHWPSESDGVSVAVFY